MEEEHRKEQHEQIAALQAIIADLKQQLKDQNKVFTQSNSQLQKYHETEQKFQTIFEDSRFGNKIISSDLTIQQVNPALVSILGYQNKEELIGSRILDFSPEEFHKDWKTLQKRLWEKTTSSFSLETRLKKRDNTLIWCQVTSILFADQGIDYGYTIVEDVDEKHKLLQHKEEFISVASHELKTPITSLKLYLQLLNNKIQTDPNNIESFKKLGQSAKALTDKLAYLVDDLLSSTKINNGQLSLNRSNFFLKESIDNCCNHLELFGNYNLVHTGSYSLMVYADQYKLEQVLANLINNAVKYAPESKDITIHTERIEKVVKVSVTDRGKGIPAIHIPHLFNRYFRINETDSKTGLGLGLYISAEIIKRHHGEIGINSEEGKGSTFWFTLPDEA